MHIREDCIVFFFIFVFETLSLAGIDPVKIPDSPLHLSKNGYLLSVEPFSLEPEEEWIVTPRDADVIILEKNKDSYLCHILSKKLIIATVLMEDRYVPANPPTLTRLTMRAPVRVKTAPHLIPKGIELPIHMKQPNGNCLVWQKVGKEELLVSVPSELKQVRYIQKSSYEQYLDSQAAKGLVPFRGKWIPKAEAEAIQNAQLAARKEKKEKWELLKAMAQDQCLILADGSILAGNYMGNDGTHVFFQPHNSKETRSISPDEIPRLPVAQALAITRLARARRLLAFAQQYLNEKEYIKCQNQQAALTKYLNCLPPDTKTEGDSLHQIIAENSRLLHQLTKDLEVHNLAIYEDRLFPADVLAYHRMKGHILFRGKEWILPSQRCRSCQEGTLPCRACRGKGAIPLICKECQGKCFLVCTICKGTARRNCPQCKGNGNVSKSCFHCGGTGLSVIRTLAPGDRNFSTSSRSCRKCFGCGYLSQPCDRCGGSGTVSCSPGKVCSNCKGMRYAGSATCQKCQGLKRTVCKFCGGKGYIGDPVKDEDMETPSKEIQPNPSPNTPAVPASDRDQSNPSPNTPAVPESKEKDSADRRAA